MKMRMTYATMFAFMLAQAALFATNQIDVRFAPSSVDNSTNSIFVDIQVKAHDKSLILAGQNYRVYYDSEKLSLDTERSEISLPGEKYTELKFHSTLEGIDATGSGDLTFDDNLGFINFSVDLKDNKKGGIELSGGNLWTTVATLRFMLKESSDKIELVWGRDGMSDDYATAFVEMAEWISPKKIESLSINEFIDLDYSLEGEDNKELLSFDFGPNPSLDFVKVNFNTIIEQEVEVRFINMAGHILKRSVVQVGAKNAIIDLSTVTAGNYIVEIESEDDRVVRSSKKLTVLK